MNNKFQTVLNVVLIAAVAVLFYKQSTTNASAGVESDESTETEQVVVATNESAKGASIVYINTDTLNEYYNYFKDLKQSVESANKRLEDEYGKKMESFQRDYAAYQQTAGNLSINQRAAKEQDLLKRKDEIEQLENKIRAQADSFQKKSEQFQKTVYAYLEKYNEEAKHQYIFAYTQALIAGNVLLQADNTLDITKEVLEGLNAEYAAKKNNK